MYLTCILYVEIGILCTSAFLICHPAEEGSEYKLQAIWTASARITEILVWRGSTIIGSCKVTDECDPNYPRFNITQIEIEKHTFSTNVTIKQVKHKDAHIWKIIYIGENLDQNLDISCKLDVVFRATNVTCHSYKDTGAVKVTCSTTKIFPQAQCRFEVYTNRNKINSSVNEVTYKHENYTDMEEEYFMSNCTYVIPKSIIQPGDYKIKATLSPDGIKNNEDVNFGSMFILTFVIESPAVALHNCFDYVEEDANISCECSAVNTTLKSIKWYDKQGHLLNDGNLLTVTGERSRPEYICQGTDYLDIKTPLVTYKPLLIEKYKKVKCSLQFFKENVVMTCYTNEICAQVSCIFYLIYNRTDTDGSQHIYSQNISENVCSPCNLLLNNSYFIQPGQYNINIFVNFNNTEKEIKYVASSFLHFNKDDNIRKEMSQSLLYQIVSCIVVVIVVVILITLAAVYIVFVKKRRRQQLSDENNDKSAQGMKTYNKRISLELESNHLYESVMEEDHYDLCVDLESPVTNSTKRNNWQDILDVEYITPLELEHCLQSQASN